MTFVLDSWAVLHLLESSGASAARVQNVIDTERPLMSWINAGEVFYIVRRRHGDGEARRTLRDLRAAVELSLPGEHDVVGAARIKSEHAMAFADAFAAALTVSNDATLLTGDPELMVVGAPWQWEDLRVAG